MNEEARDLTEREEMFNRGMETRAEVVGDDVVKRSFDAANEFDLPMQELVTRFCWGEIWGRPGLDRRSRSLLNIGMLAAANRPDELAGHIKGAIANGLTRDEIREALLQVACYLGMPAGLGAFRIARAVFDQMDAERETQSGERHATHTNGAER